METLKKPELLFYANSTLLEGPVWSKELQLLMCVSIEQGIIYLLDINRGIIQSIKTKGEVGFACFEDGDNIVAASYEGVYRINIYTGKQQFITHLLDKPYIRYNDGILDRKGRILMGTTGYRCFAPNENYLVSWDGRDKKKLIEKTSISNGIDFSLDGEYMYFVDTPTNKVSRYKYCMETGEIAFDKNVIEIQDGGSPDGICVDIDDSLWVAQWGGYKVSHWNPYTGEKLGEIKLSCQNVSSCCIGGKGMNYLFVTTAKHDDGSESEEMAGGLFAVKIRE